MTYSYEYKNYIYEYKKQTQEINSRNIVTMDHKKQDLIQKYRTMKKTKK